MTTRAGFFGTVELRTIWNKGKQELPYLFLYDPSSNRWSISRARQHLDQMAHAYPGKPSREQANNTWRGYYFVGSCMLYIYPRWRGAHGAPPSPSVMRSIRSRLKGEFGSEPVEEYLIGEDPWVRPHDVPFVSQEAS